jgi:hypothetical protein
MPIGNAQIEQHGIEVFVFRRKIERSLDIRRAQHSRRPWRLPQ